MINIYAYMYMRTYTYTTICIYVCVRIKNISICIMTKYYANASLCKLKISNKYLLTENIPKIIYIKNQCLNLNNL